MILTSSCYICDPFNPGANPEGCEKCDREYQKYQLEIFDQLAAVKVHRRGSTDIGPDFCRGCSEAIQDWVAWPCAGSGEED